MVCVVVAVEGGGGSGGCVCVSWPKSLRMSLKPPQSFKTFSYRCFVLF